jgi:hypothetical protein
MTHCVKTLRINWRRNSKRIPRSRTQQLPRNRTNKSFHAVRVKELILHLSPNNQQRTESAVLINRWFLFSVRGELPESLGYKLHSSNERKKCSSVTDQQGREGIYNKDNGSRGISAVEETMGVQSQYLKRGARSHVGRRHDTKLIDVNLGQCSSYTFTMPLVY